MKRLSLSCAQSRRARCLLAAVTVLLFIGPILAVEHGHAGLEVDDTGCAVCLHQQSEWFPEISAPELAPDRAVETREVPADVRVAVARRILIEPLRGPPALA